MSAATQAGDVVDVRCVLVEGLNGLSPMASWFVGQMPEQWQPHWSAEYRAALVALADAVDEHICCYFGQDVWTDAHLAVDWKEMGAALARVRAAQPQDPGA